MRHRLQHRLRIWRVQREGQRQRIRSRLQLRFQLCPRQRFLLQHSWWRSRWPVKARRHRPSSWPARAPIGVRLWRKRAPHAILHHPLRSPRARRLRPGAAVAPASPRGWSGWACMLASVAVRLWVNWTRSMVGPPHAGRRTGSSVALGPHEGGDGGLGWGRQLGLCHPRGLRHAPAGKLATTACTGRSHGHHACDDRSDLIRRSFK